MNTKDFLIPEGGKLKLKDHRTDFTGDYKNEKEAQADLDADTEKLSDLQEKLFAEETKSLLLVFQAMDTAGKDGAIRHVTTGVNPQGFRVVNFKPPGEEQLKHDYLWHFSKKLPERGLIGVFNRSYYEEVLIVRVHPERLQKLPEEIKNNKNIWKERFEQINNFEKYLTQNGTHVLKFFLNVSKEEQKTRILDRIKDENENWKFDDSDITERGFWDEYIEAYEDAISATSTEIAPWYIIPADHKWFSRVAIARIIVEKLKSMKPKFPKVSEEQKRAMKEAKKTLEKE